MMFGYDQAVFSGIIVTDNFLELHGLVGPTKTGMVSTVTAIYDIGCLIGAILAFTIGERLGRNKAIIWGTSIMAVGAILMSTSYSLPQMFVGRIILGIGNGINTATGKQILFELSTLAWSMILLSRFFATAVWLTQHSSSLAN